MTVPPAVVNDAGLYPPKARPADGLLPLPLFFARFVRNPLTALPKQIFEADIAASRYLGQEIAWVSGPALIERIFLKDHEQFPKTPLDKRVLGPIVGNGILTSEGADWRWQRRIAAPLFRHTELVDYVPIMAQAAQEQLERWRKLPAGAASEIEADMTAATFAVVSRTVLAGCDESEAEIIQSTGRDFLTHSSWQIAYGMLGIPEWVWHPGKGAMLAAARDERAAVSRLIARRLAEAAPGDDLLARLVAARHPETGEPMSGEKLLDNVLTFLAAGHETTAKALTWALYLLARAPDWQERVREEARRVAGDRPIEPADVDELKAAGKVIKETLRLYPAAPVLTRLGATEVTLDGITFKKGTQFIVPVYAVHRHRRLWDDPDRFDPERFEPELEAARPRAAFMPFGYGPRTCIGAAFAMIEATVMLATLVRGARFTWDGRLEPEPVNRVTLRPRGGMPLGVTVLAS